MVKHIWTVLTQRSIVESQTNAISLIDVLEEFTVGVSGPVQNGNILPINVPINYELVTYLTRDNNEEGSMLRIEMLNPKGEILKRLENPIGWEKGKSRLRARVTIVGITVFDSGTYAFRVGLKEKGEKDYKTVAEVPLEVKIESEKLKLEDKG